MGEVERQTLRALAGRWMELASLPVMAERKRLWAALKDLRAERPMIHFETWTLESFVEERELVCADPDLREVELVMRRYIRQVEEIGDDYVIEPFWKLAWHVETQDYGVELFEVHAEDGFGNDVAYHFNHPIQTPQELDRLRPRQWRVDRQKTLRWKERLEGIFGDLLPVRLHGTGGLHAGLTGEVFKLIGNDNLLTWPYDAPQALHRLMAYLRDDRLAYYQWLENEGLLGLNNDDAIVGSGSFGYTSALPQPDFAGQVRLKDLWVFMESQETTVISPGMFARFFLPYMAEITRRFGLVYYGCCEPVHDRWERILQAIPNVRAVSISPWCDMRRMGELLGRSVVFSRKPIPWLISGDTPDWDGLKRDLADTLAAARDCNLEILFRDVYRIADRQRLARWVQMVRAEIGR